MRLTDNAYLISGNRQKLDADVGRFLSSTILRLRRAGADWIENRKRAREIEALNRFSDRELWDVGLSRSDVWSIERGTFRRGE